MNNESRHTNISLRDWVAATVKADVLPSITDVAHLPELARLANVEMIGDDSSLEEQLKFSVAITAYLRYLYADAMLAQSQK